MSYPVPCDADVDMSPTTGDYGSGMSHLIYPDGRILEYRHDITETHPGFLAAVLEAWWEAWGQSHPRSTPCQTKPTSS